VTIALLSWLRKRLGRSSEPDFQVPKAHCAGTWARAPETAVGTQPLPGSSAAVRLEDDLDLRFSALLLGLRELRPGPIVAAERGVIEAIEQLARDGDDPRLIPRLPVVLPRLISLVRRDDASPRELAESLASDPTLVGEVVRIANSPRYRSGRDIANLQQAVIVLGQRGLVQLVMQAAVRPIFNIEQGRFSKVAGTRPWDLAERCAHAGAYLCGGTADPFQAYLGGLVANVGWIPSLRALDAIYVERRPPDTLAFHAALVKGAGRLSSRIARLWNFHAEVCEAVERLGQPVDAAADAALGDVLRLASRISKRHLLMPGQSGSDLAGLTDTEQRGYTELERRFGR